MNKPEELRQTDGKVKTTIHLNQSVYTWAQENMVEQGFDKFTEYMSHLIRQDRRTLMSQLSGQARINLEDETESDSRPPEGAESVAAKGKAIRQRILEKRDDALNKGKR